LQKIRRTRRWPKATPNEAIGANNEFRGSNYANPEPTRIIRCFFRSDRCIIALPLNCALSDAKSGRKLGKVLQITRSLSGADLLCFSGGEKFKESRESRDRSLRREFIIRADRRRCLSRPSITSAALCNVQ